MQHLHWPQSRVEAPVKSWLSKFWKIPNLCLSFQVVVLVSNGLVSIGSTSRRRTWISPLFHQLIGKLSNKTKWQKLGFCLKKGGGGGLGSNPKHSSKLTKVIKKCQNTEKKLSQNQVFVPTYGDRGLSRLGKILTFAFFLVFSSRHSLVSLKFGFFI